MAVPKYSELLTPLLIFLSDGKEHNYKEMTAYCADAFKLSDEDRELCLGSGNTVLYNRVAWAKTYLKKAGLATNAGKGLVRLTEEGLRVAATDADKVNIAYLMRYDTFKAFLHHTESGSSTPAAGGGSVSAVPPESEVPAVSPREQIANAIAEMNDALADDLMEEVMKISPYDFERLIIRLLVAMGYGSMLNNGSAVTRKSGDEGIDGVLTADKFGFDAIYIQAKQWKEDSVVGRPEVQKFCGAMMGQGAAKGLFITTARFSNEAIEYAKKHLTSKIVLVDGAALSKLMIEYDIGVSVVDVYKVKKVDSDFFADFE